MYRNTSHGQTSFLGVSYQELCSDFWLQDEVYRRMTYYLSTSNNEKKETLNTKGEQFSKKFWQDVVERVHSTAQYLVCLCDTLSQYLIQNSTDSLQNSIISPSENWSNFLFYWIRVISRNEKSCPDFEQDTSFVSMTRSEKSYPTRLLFTFHF